MKYILLILLSLHLCADKLKVDSLACPTQQTFSEIDKIDQNNYVEFNLFAMKNSCKILNSKSHIDVIDYDVNSRSKFIKIQVHDSSEVYYILRENVTIEQPGNNNTFKF